MNKLIVTGLIAAMLAGATGAAALQADPFDTARYDIGIKKNAEALAIVDSGQFEVNFQTDEGYSLLHYAADAGNLEMVRALLARGANPNLKSSSGRTPYDMATAPLVKAELAKAMGKSAPAAASRPAAAAKPAAKAAPAATGRKLECQQKYRADAALCSDTTCKMSASRRWQQCLNTGRYW